MRKYILILIIIASTWWAVKPLFHSGFFPMHDDQQIARLYELDQSVKGGQIPPRWVANLGFGYGYPLFNFYPPMVYYLGELFHLVGFDLITSIKIVMALGFILAAISMYLLVRELVGKKEAVLAAVLYTYAPYHSLDIYVRGALAEFFSFVFFPLIILAIRKFTRSPSLKTLLFLTFSTSGLVLTHNLMVAPFSIFAGIYYLYCLLSNKKNAKKIILFTFYFLLSTFSLTAYFTLPAIFEKPHTLVDEILTRELASFRLHFVYLRQLWDSAWGYGGSLYGLEDGISFQIGKVHILLSAIGAIASVIVLYKKKNKEFAVLSALLALSIYLITFPSMWLWNLVKPLWYLQFSWRFLAITALFTSILSAYGVNKLLKGVKNNYLKYTIILLIITITIIMNKDYFQPDRYLKVTDANYITKEDISWRISKTSFEFVPKGVATTLSDIDTTQLAIKQNEIAQSSYSVEKGVLAVQEVQILPQKKVLKVQSDLGGTIRINTFNFPGWEAMLDEKKTTISDKNKLKLITIIVPKGDHEVTVEFKNTPIRTLGNSLTMVTILVLVMVIAKKRFFNFKF